MNFGFDWHGIGAIDEKAARSLVDLALERGVTLFDTADIYGYGAAETMLGKILGKRRSKVLIATKLLGRMRPEDPASGGLSARRVAQALDESLKRLRTDYVDLYMPHGWDFEVPIEETMTALEKARAAGKVRVLGCSNFSGEQLESALALGRLEFDQVQYSLASRFIEGDLAPVCAREGVSLLAWSPLGGGLLAARAGRPPRFPHLPEARLSGLVDVLKKSAALDGVLPVQAALAWTAGRPGVASAVVGARTREQLEQTLSFSHLSAKARAFLDRASDACAVR
jgi:aryl-alcohol dehydrogenase-like predicted oxidoreductase